MQAEMLLDRPVRADSRLRRVLHAGCGARGPNKLHAVFRGPGWSETRLDISPLVDPDIICSIHDMHAVVESGAYDAIWSSHNIEHLHGHEVAGALGEFRRVLRPDGFALIRCPDLEAVAEMLLRDGPDEIVYRSPAGPITPLDMLYGHGASVARGHAHMRHHTGFTAARLGKLLLDAGFAEVRTRRAANYDLWAVAFMPQAATEQTIADLAATGLVFEP